MSAQRSGSMYRMCSLHADGLNHLDNMLNGFPSPLVNSISILIGRETLEY